MRTCIDAGISRGERDISPIAHTVIITLGTLLTFHIIESPCEERWSIGFGCGIDPFFRREIGIRDSEIVHRENLIRSLRADSECTVAMSRLGCSFRSRIGYIYRIRECIGAEE